MECTGCRLITAAVKQLVSPCMKIRDCCGTCEFWLVLDEICGIKEDIQVEEKLQKRKTCDTGNKNCVFLSCAVNM
jgi:hypothetical protein